MSTHSAAFLLYIHITEQTTLLPNQYSQPDSALIQLQELLLANDRHAAARLRDELADLGFELNNTQDDVLAVKTMLDDMHRQWESPDMFAQRVEPIVNLKIQELRNNFSQLFAHEINRTVRIGIRNSRDEFVDALYPIIGKMVSKYVRDQFDGFLDDVGTRLEKGISPRWWLNRIKALFSGVSSQELLLSETLSYRIEEVFFIQHHTGLLLASYSRNNTLDLDMIAGMLTAIRSFVGDAFANAQEQQNDLESIGYGEYKIVLTNFQRYYAASVVSGNITTQHKRRLEELLTYFASEHIPADDLYNITGSMHESISAALKESFEKAQYF